MVYDDFECTFKCLHHPLCVSVNLAAEGDLWCELLSSDKYSNPNEYKEKKSSHHYFFEVRTIYTLVASLELYCFKKDLEKQKENAVTQGTKQTKRFEEGQNLFFIIQLRSSFKNVMISEQLHSWSQAWNHRFNYYKYICHCYSSICLLVKDRLWNVCQFRKKRIWVGENWSPWCVFIFWRKRPTYSQRQVDSCPAMIS